MRHFASLLVLIVVSAACVAAVPRGLTALDTGNPKGVNSALYGRNKEEDMEERAPFYDSSKGSSWKRDTVEERFYNPSKGMAWKREEKMVVKRKASE